MKQSNYQRIRKSHCASMSWVVAHVGTQLHLVAQGIMLLAIFVLTGCAVNKVYKAYPGAVKAISEVGMVTSGEGSVGLLNKYIAILKIDGKEELEEWNGGVPLYLLPGEHGFRVELKQNSRPTSIPIVDLVTAVQDASAALENVETNIAFPVKAGLVHRIHYDDSQHVFSVSLAKLVAGPEQPTTLQPASDAALCVNTPDKTKDFWCGLRP
jgi:hypothetical protein